MASTVLEVLRVKLAHKQQQDATAPLSGYVNRNIEYILWVREKDFSCSTVSSMQQYTIKKVNYSLDYFLSANKIWENLEDIESLTCLQLKSCSNPVAENLARYKTSVFLDCTSLDTFF